MHTLKLQLLNCFSIRILLLFNVLTCAVLKVSIRCVHTNKLLTDLVRVSRKFLTCSHVYRDILLRKADTMQDTVDILYSSQEAHQKHTHATNET